MRSLVVLPLVLCVVLGVNHVTADQVTAVKLCGREFLRAVVYTCGGSRWRRLLSETDMDGESELVGQKIYSYCISYMTSDSEYIS